MRPDLDAITDEYVDFEPPDTFEMRMLNQMRALVVYCRQLEERWDHMDGLVFQNETLMEDLRLVRERCRQLEQERIELRLVLSAVLESIAPRNRTVPSWVAARAVLDRDPTPECNE